VRLLGRELARAFDAAGQSDSAVALHEAFIGTPYYKRLVETGPLALALADERLGEVYEARGDAARAAAHDQRFIALWANADPALQPRVAQARVRLVALGAHEGTRRMPRPSCIARGLLVWSLDAVRLLRVSPRLEAVIAHE
jgi:hypothetical protein